jgi:hypothetical protein
MKKTILKYYAYLVCFVTLSCGAILFGVGMYDVVEIAAPGYMLSDKIVQGHNDNESFIQYYYKSNLYEYLTDDQITNQRLKSLDQAIGDQRNDAIRGLIIAFVVLLINIGIFYIHWSMVEKRRLVH